METTQNKCYYLTCFTVHGYQSHAAIFPSYDLAEDAGKQLMESDDQVHRYLVEPLCETDALEAWLDHNDWRIYYYDIDGVQAATLERHTNLGTEFFLNLRPFTADEYRKAVNKISPADEAFIMWKCSNAYRDVMGDIRTACNDLCDTKQLLINQLKNLHV
jgi:hypothetical protein